MMTESSRQITQSQKILSALFYGTTSFLIMNINKYVLTVKKFPSAQVLGISQIVSTILILSILHIFKIINLPACTPANIRKVFPLPLFFLGNLMFGLLGTKGLALPMQIALRRFSVLLTMILEIFILRKKPDRTIISCVLVMILGSIIAASDSLMFDFIAYTHVMCNNVCTASQAVYTKMKLDSNELGKNGLLFYNAILSFPLVLVLCHSNGDFIKANNFMFNTPGQGWYSGPDSDSTGDSSFKIYFLLSCIMGLILNYSIYLCTQYNSALVTTVIGCLKNILITYLGIIFPTEDYVFNWTNFLGLSISIVGSVVFSYVSFKKKKVVARPLSVISLKEVLKEVTSDEVKLLNDKI